MSLQETVKGNVRLDIYALAPHVACHASLTVSKYEAHAMARNIDQALEDMELSREAT